MLLLSTVAPDYEKENTEPASILFQADLRYWSEREEWHSAKFVLTQSAWENP